MFLRIAVWGMHHWFWRYPDKGLDLDSWLPTWPEAPNPNMTWELTLYPDLRLDSPPWPMTCPWTSTPPRSLNPTPNHDREPNLEPRPRLPTQHGTWLCTLSWDLILTPSRDLTSNPECELSTLTLDRNSRFWTKISHSTLIGDLNPYYHRLSNLTKDPIRANFDTIHRLRLKPRVQPQSDPTLVPKLEASLKFELNLRSVLWYRPPISTPTLNPDSTFDPDPDHVRHDSRSNSQPQSPPKA